MLSVVAQVKAQARLANAELIFYFLKTPNALHTKQNEKILTRSNADKELSGLGFLRHLIQKEDSLSLNNSNKKQSNKNLIKIPNLLGIPSIKSKEQLISNLTNN